MNLTRASIRKTARDPIIVKDNAVIAADVVGPEASVRANTPQ